MQEKQNVQIVKDMYAAFNRGDIPFILGQLSPNVKWMSHLDPVIPWSGDRAGRVPDFFKDINDSVEVQGFEPDEYVAEGNTVVSTGTFACAAKTSGRAASTKWTFIWKFTDGKVTSYEQFSDPELATIFRN